MDKNEILKYGLIAAGVYFLWPYIKTLLPSTAPATPDVPAAPDQPVYLNTAQLVAQAAAAARMGPQLNAYQWNWFYKQVRGVDGPDPEQAWPGRDPSYLMPVAEWWAGANTAGFTGLGAYMHRRPAQVRRPRWVM